jgi:hypothetical protein
MMIGCGGSGGNGFGGGGTNGGNTGGLTGPAAINGFYTGVVGAQPAKSRAIGDSVSFQFNGTSGTALFSRTKPALFTYTAVLSNISLNTSTKKLTFTLGSFTSDYTSGTYNGTCTFNTSGHILSAVGALIFKLPNGTTENDSLTISFQPAVTSADFTGHWTGTLQASLLGGTPSAFSFVGDFKQDSTGNLTANITYTDPKSGVPYSGPLNAKAAGNTFAGTQALAVPSFGTGNGSINGVLNSDGSMSGSINVTEDVGGATPLTVITGSFKATKTQTQASGEGFQFINATQNSSNHLLGASADSTVLSTGTAQGAESALVQVPVGTSLVRVAQLPSNTLVFSSTLPFAANRRVVFVAVDDVSGSQVETGAVVYSFPSTLTTGQGSLGVVQGINTDSNHFGANIDIYVTPAGQSMGSTPPFSNLPYGAASNQAFAAGQYTLTATSTGVPSDVVATGTVTLAANQRLVAVLVSPPALAAKFEDFTAASF